MVLLAMLGGWGGSLAAQNAAVVEPCAVPVVPRTTVKLDLSTRRFETPIPFNEPFSLQVAIATSDPRPDRVHLRYGEQRFNETPPGAVDAERFEALGEFVVGRPVSVHNERVRRYVTVDDVSFRIRPLAPNREYLFEFIFFGSQVRRDTLRIPFVGDVNRVVDVRWGSPDVQIRRPTAGAPPVLLLRDPDMALRDTVKIQGLPDVSGRVVPRGSIRIRLVDGSGARRVVKDSIRIRVLRDSASVFTLLESEGVRVQKDTVEMLMVRDTGRAQVGRDTVRVVGEAKTDITHHFDTDAGLLHSFRANYWGAVTGTHLYLVPVNRNECRASYSGWEHILKRVSLFGGLSVFELDARSGVEPLFTGGSPVFGLSVGERFPFFGRLFLNGGIILLKQEDPNPLLDAKHTRRDYFVGVAADVELKSIFGPLAGLVGLK